MSQLIGGSVTDSGVTAANPTEDMTNNAIAGETLPQCLKPWG